MYKSFVDFRKNQQILFQSNFHFLLTNAIHGINETNKATVKAVAIK